MKSVHDIENSIKRIDMKAGAQMHERVLGGLVQKMEISKQNESAKLQQNIWRKIMNSRLTKIAAVIMILMGASITIAVLISQTGEQGVKFTVLFNKLVWTSDETPVLLADLSHRGRSRLNIVDSYDLIYDGAAYEVAQDSNNDWPVSFNTDTDYRRIPFVLDNRWLNKQTGTQLKITPGNHKASLSFNAKIQDGSEERTVKIESNTAEFKVLDSGQKITEEIELKTAIGGMPGKKYTEEEVAAMHLKKYGEKLSYDKLAKFYCDLAMETKDSDTIECALAFKQGDLDTLKLYNNLGQAYYIQKNITPKSLRRRIQARVYLAGLNYALNLDLGKVEPGRMPILTYYDKDAEISASRLPLAAITVAQDVEKLHDMIDERQLLISSIIYLYNDEPNALNELRELAVEYIKNERVADELVNAVKTYRESNNKISFSRDIYIRGDDRKFEKIDSFQVYDSNGFKIEAGFVPDKKEIILGENISMTFYVKNLGQKPYEFFVGGDSRGSIRHNNFHITAVDENGVPVEDPFSYDNFGGPGNYMNIEQGEIYAERLYLGHWCRFEKPGIFTVTCSRTLSPIRQEESPEVPVKVSFKLNIVPSNKNNIAQLVKQLGEQVDTGDEGQVREASMALSEIKDKSVIPHLVEVMKKRIDWRSKNPAIDGLKQFSILDVSEGLILGLKDNDYVVRNHAAQAVSEMQGNDFVREALLRELNSKDNSETELTLRALGEIGGEKAFNVLKTTLENENNQNIEARCSAAEAIGSLGDANGIKELEKFVEDKNFDLRLAAVRGMISLKQPVQAKWLTPVIKGTDIDKKGFQVVTNNETRSIEIIETGGINSQNFHEAIRLLRLYGKEQAGPGLVSCLKFDDPSVKSSYNFYLMMAIEACKEVPKHPYTYHHDPNKDGSPEQIEENRKILDFYKTWLESQ